MLFNSYGFIFIFLPITFFVYFYLNNKKLTKASKSFLVASSLFFYSWWNIIYLPLLLISILFNYTVGSILSGEKDSRNISKKKLLAFGIIGNMSLLVYFKYADFFIENINFITTSNIPTLDLVLPLALSFFTFQQIAYLVDSYRKETKEYDFLNYVVFVSFFPQLIAGPIVHHKEMMPQFSKVKNKLINYKNIALGLLIFSIGLFKKVIIADTFAIWATHGFDVAEKLNFIEAWATSLSYTFQLYFDFSGYTDMAIGIALLFNIKLPINFNSPYKATDIQDFWRRWHITLSRFLRDYVYIPLGGNRKGNFRTYTNLLATFVIGGLWHGAGWTFIFWGFLHGFGLGIHRVWQKIGFKLNIVIAWFLTFNFVNIAWIFFRAKEWEDAIKILKGMTGIMGIGSLSTLISFADINAFQLLYMLIVILITCVTIFMKNTNSLNYHDMKKKKMYIGIALLLWISILHLNRVTEFLYFNF